LRVWIGVRLLRIERLGLRWEDLGASAVKTDHAGVQTERRL
jgi:hypothetical protein